jgi:hypothetical protein
MDIDYGHYLHALADLAGITNWQYLFCEVDRKNPHFDFYFEDIRKGMKALKTILPDHDLSFYEKKLSR